MEKLLGELTAQELARGYYKHASGRYICCLCGEAFEPGQVYPMEGRFYDAEHAVQRHVEAHGGAFEALLGEPGRTGLDEQMKLIGEADERLRRREAEVEHECAQRSRLIRTLGVTAGAAVFLLLI